MTKEAKIGLLLGLGFIVAIAVVLRDVNKAGDDGVGESLLVSQEEIERVGPEEGIIQDGVNELAERQRDMFRSEQDQFAFNDQRDMGLGQGNNTEDVIYTQDFPWNRENQKDVPRDSSQGMSMDRMREIIEGLSGDSEETKKVILPPDPPKPQIYVVQSGDSLTRIAEKVYGKQTAQELWRNIERIHKSNLKIIPSKDDLTIGQRLAIPGMKIKPGGLFENMVPGKHVVKQDSPKPVEPVKPPVPKKPEYEIYVVQEGDSLWKIAQAKLGNGNRYKEIRTLNVSVVKSEDTVQPGWKLKLPKK